MGRNREREDEGRGCLPGPLRVAWNAVQVFAALYGFLTVIYLIGRITVGETWAIIAYFDNGIMWLAVVALVLGVLVVFSRYRALLITLQLPVAIAFLVLYWPVLLPADAPAPGEGTQIRVASYNILSGQSDAEAVVDVIAALDADIVALHELGPEHADLIDTAFAGTYPYRVLDPSPSEHRGAGLLSRYPVLEEESFTLTAESFTYLRVVLDVDGAPVTVFAAHPQPPKNRSIPFAYDPSPRDRELAALRDDYLTHEDGPLLVLCDCNMSDQSDAYGQMDDLLHDAFWEVGHGLGFTFQSRLPFPFLRVDYVWYSDAFRPLEAGVGDDAGTSDHRPVFARLERLPEGAP